MPSAPPLSARCRISLVALLVLTIAGCSPSPSGPSIDAPSGDASGGDVTAGSDALAPDVAAEGDADATSADVAADGSQGPRGGDTVDDGGVTEDAAAEDAGPDVTAPFANCSEPGGARNIYDLQDPQCPDHFNPEPIGSPGQPVTISDVVVTAVLGDTLFVQEPTGGPYSGIAIYGHGLGLDLLVGDVVTMTGNYFEFYDLSEIYLESYELTGTTTPLEPWTGEHPGHFATGGPLAEMFEGVLIRVEDVETYDTKPDCPHDFGEFSLVGGLRVDDMAHGWTPHLGDTFSAIVGPLHYTFGNFKIEPRGDDDLHNPLQGSDAVTKCIQAECIAPETALGAGPIRVTEVMPDPYGADASQEWIEIYNGGTEAQSLDGWKLRDCAEQQITLTGPATNVPAGGYLVLGAQADPNLNGGVPVDLAYGSGFYLPNTHGAVLLYDDQGVLVDHTRYSRFDPWEAFSTGRSIARVSPDAPGPDPGSWVKGAGVYGLGENQGTPGGPNGGW